MEKKIRPLGKITEDIEPLLCEMIEDHLLQRHEVIGLIFGYMQAHFPESEELYIDKSKAILYYGPIQKIKKTSRSKK
jgi:hypothetical protein